jgi:DNA polymerase-3 subunit delta
MMMLVEFLGNDLSRIANEINKLEIILPKGSKITPSHIEENIGFSKDFNVFEFRKAIGEKNQFKAYQIADYFAKNPKDNPLVMTTGLVLVFLGSSSVSWFKR